MAGFPLRVLEGLKRVLEAFDTYAGEFFQGGS
jgi:hypothetical protein